MQLSCICTKGGAGRVLASLILALGLATAVQAQCPGEGDCCEANGSIGCDDAKCCSIVCEADPFCCESEWDGLCAGLAKKLCGDLCGGGGGDNDNCADAIEIFNGSTAYTNIGATDDGPEIPDGECSVDFPAGELGSDIWFVYNSSFSGTLFVSTCDSVDYDSFLASYTGDCGALELHACNDDGVDCLNFTSLMEVPVEPGGSYLIRVGGFNGAQGSGTLVLTKDANNPACPGDGCCFEANGSPGCDDADCCNDVCAADAFCCDSEWDEICAESALDLCFDAGDCPGDTNGDSSVDVQDLSNVIIAWGTQGADGADLNADCIVDVQDLTLVIVNWGTCAPAEGCGAVDAGDCFVPNGTPYCDDQACCEAICAQDAFCCDVEWDGICADAAGALCAPGACCFTDDGSCIDVENGGDCVGMGGVFQGPNTICKQVECPVLVNDACEDRVDLDFGSTAFTNIGATLDGPSPCGALDSDVWFNFTAVEDGTVEINTCDGSTDFDSVLAVYDGCECPADIGTLITCNDDFCGLQSRVLFDVIAGQCYKVQVGGFAGSQGTGTLVVQVGIPPCGEGSGDCFIPNGTPGCEDVDCCEAVCAQSPFCCDFQWDAFCADVAGQLCAPGACCFSDGTCIDVETGSECAALGGVFQGPDTVCDNVVCPIVDNDNCKERNELTMGSTPFSNIGANSDGPSPCGAMEADVWYNFNADFDGTIEINTCDGSTSFDTVIAVYDGCDCPVDEGTLIACNDDFCGLQSRVIFNVIAGQCYKVQVGGFAGAMGTGTLVVQEAAPICGEGAGDCFIPNGTPGCEDVECCQTVCAADPFCCDIEWDALCADSALILCATKPQACCFQDGTCEDILPGDCIGAGGTNQGADTFCKAVFCVPVCGEGAGDCFIPNGSPGCEDIECCLTVCGIDPFCCDVEWDGICADSAITICAEPCEVLCEGGTDEGEDCGSDTNGGCNSTPTVFGSISCGETICGTAWASGGTRDTDWFEFTIDTDTFVSAQLTSAFGGVCFIVDGIGTCSPVVVGDTGASAVCEPGVPASAVLSAGTYVVFVATSGFDGVPCGGGNNSYTVTLTCDAGFAGPSDGVPGDEMTRTLQGDIR